MKLVVLLPAFFVGCKESLAPAKDNIEDLTKKIQQDSLNPELYVRRSSVFASIRDFERAFEDAQKAFQLDSSKFGFVKHLADVAFVNDKIALHQRLLLKAYSMDSTNIEVLLDIGKLEVYKGNFKKAIIYINKALKEDQYLDKGYFLKGICYKTIMDTVKANSSFLTASEINPNHYQAFYELGLLNLNKPIAIDYFRACLDIKPGSLRALQGLGWCYQDMGKPKMAKEAFAKIIQLYPGEVAGYYNLGTVYLQQEAFDSAQYLLKKVILINPNHIKANYNLGITYEHADSLVKAKLLYENCLRLNPDFQLAKERLEALY